MKKPTVKEMEGTKRIVSKSAVVPGHAPAKRIAILSLISADCDTVPAMNAKARQFHNMGAHVLEELGFRTIRPNGPTRTSVEAVRHFRLMEDAGAEAVVLYIADWSYSTTAAIGALRSNRLPLILWTNAQPDCAGLIGAAITKGGLNEVGLDAPLVYGNFDDEGTHRDLKTYCNGAAAAARLRGMRYGLGGTRSLEMLTSVVDPNVWLTKFGIDVDGFDELDVAERAKSVPNRDILRHKKWLKQTFGRVEVADIIVEMNIRLYLALKEVIAEKKFDFISVKCLPVMPSIMTSFCLAHALLGDAVDADGPKERMICGCESDSNGALTMQMMKNVDDQAIGFADVRHLDPDGNILRISNCGAQATELARCPKDIHWVRHGLQELPWKHGGMCPQCVSKPGVVTLARLARIQGRYIMMISGGEALDRPRAALKETYWGFSPHTFIRLNAPTNVFVNQLRSNHIHLMYGDWLRDLVHLCRVLEIEPVIPENLK